MRFFLILSVLILNFVIFAEEKLNYLGQIICNSNQKQKVFFSIFGKKTPNFHSSNLSTYLQYVQDNYFLAQVNPGKCNENGTLTIKLEKPLDALILLKFLADIYNYQYFFEGNTVYKPTPLMFYKKNITLSNLEKLIVNNIKEHNEKLNVSFLRKKYIAITTQQVKQTFEENSCNPELLNNFLYICKEKKCKLYLVSTSGKDVALKEVKNCKINISTNCKGNAVIKKLVVDNVNLVHLIKIFENTLNLNFIYDEKKLSELKHSKNLHIVLTCVNKNKALNFLTKNYQLVLKPITHNTYRIFTNPTDYSLVLEKVSNLESKVFYLQNIKAEDFVKFINTFYRDKVIYSVDPVFNAVSIIAPPQIIREIEERWKKYLKGKNSFEKLMTKIFYLKFGDINQLKNNIKKYLSDWGKVKILNNAQAIEIIDYPTNIAMIQNVFGKFLSQKPIKIKITAKFVRINKSFARSLGLNWSFTYGEALKTKSISWSANYDNNGLVNSFQFLYKKFNPITLQISAAETLSLAKTLSSPTLILLNNQQGTISSGVQIPYQSVDQNGNPKTDLVSATLSLNVHPQLLPDGKILLKLQLSKDSPNTALSVNGQPAINTFTINQDFIVGNGDTLVIGGVIEKTQDKGEAGVPVLRSIPILGWLFKNKNWDRSEDELMVFITAQIVNE
jgi:type II secretory pathway component GspD/PulD (secretin)